MIKFIRTFIRLPNKIDLLLKANSVNVDCISNNMKIISQLMTRIEKLEQQLHQDKAIKEPKIKWAK